MSSTSDEKPCGAATRSVAAGRRAEWTGTPGHPSAVVSPPVWRASTHLYASDAERRKAIVAYLASLKD